ncbi:MAG: hypothetical protein WCW30_04775 [Candidatus Gracilibacteria bacterium]|jgi:hypothetical protein
MNGKFLFKMVLVFMIFGGMGCQSRGAITQLSLEFATERPLFQRAIFSADDPYSFREVEVFEDYVYPYVDEQGVEITGNALSELSREQLEVYFVRAWPFYDPVNLVENDPETFYQNFINEEGVFVLSQEDMDSLLSIMAVASQEIDTSFVVPSEKSKVELPYEFPLSYFFSDFPFWADLLNIGSTSFKTAEDEVWHTSVYDVWENVYDISEWSALNIIQDPTEAWVQYVLFIERTSPNQSTPVFSEDSFETLQIVLAYDEYGFLRGLVAFDKDRELPTHDESLLMYLNFLYDEREILTGINVWRVGYESNQLAVPRLVYQNYRYLHD